MTEVLLYPSKLTTCIKFPATLWDMVNKCKSGAISWGRFGNCIKINKNIFEREYLISGEKPFSSFIRQLNVYGFRKLKNQIKYVRMSAEFSNDVMEYQHPLFVKGHPELLPYLRRKVRHGDRCGNQPTKKSVKEKYVELDGSSSCETVGVDNFNKQTDRCAVLQKDSLVYKTVCDLEVSSNSQKLTKPQMDEIFQVVSQSLSKEMTAYGGGAWISGPVFPSFNLSSPNLIQSRK